MEGDRVSTTLAQNKVQPRSNSLTLSDNYRAYRGFVLPAVLALVLGPTANIQMSYTYNSCNSTNVQIRRRQDEFTCESYEFYSESDMPRWEESRVPRLQTVGHIHATLEFKGNLKWLPYQQDI